MAPPRGSFFGLPLPEPGVQRGGKSKATQQAAPEVKKQAAPELKKSADQKTKK
jgi:hypothetical protein